MAENIPDLIFRYDGDCRRVYANPAAERALKTPNATFAWMAGGDAPDVSFERDCALAMRLRQAIETGQFIECDEQSPGPDGTQRQFHTRYVPEVGESGAATGILVIAHDVTERNRTQEALAKSNAELDRFFTLALDMFSHC